MEADDLYVLLDRQGKRRRKHFGLFEAAARQRIFLFGTAGFGGSEEYFNKILKKVEGSLDRSKHSLRPLYVSGQDAAVGTPAV